MKNRELFFGISLALIVPGIIFLAMGGLKPGIDFTGGSQTQYSFQKTVHSNDVRQAFQTAGIKDA